ncbi:lipopolysaccharide biosynthesis protein [Rugamonas sp. DEMB1]|uniref:lipopolysaccharide biosynthesis protein n=1 Tax=Rugamonas sp. DEMB1 TaxID=3039386 RepID=UPI002447D8DA|nr:lipopolysaccharide biosynthesis protein [Rugamonas sp. DEMB1]WGG49135.1 lipopolysaccharide biosynthesis protein [Rugamonas sp. DEMB1]
MAYDKVFNSVLWSVAKNWGGRLTSLVVFMVLTRLLDARAVGAVAFVGAILAVLVSLAEMGLAEYLIYRQDDEASRNQIFWFQVYVASAVFALAVLLGPPVLRAVGQHDAAQVFPYLCLILPLASLTSVQDAIQRRALKFKGVAIRSLVGMLVGGALGVATAAAGGGMWSLVVKQLAESVVIAGLLWRMSDWRPRWRCDWAGFGKIFHYGRYLAGGRLLDVLTTNVDDMIVGLAIGQNQLGLYSIGKKLYMMSAELLTGVAYQISGPIFAKARQDGAALWSMFVKVVGYCSWLVVPLYSALYFFAPEVVLLLFGEKWGGAVWILQTYCFVGMLIPLYLFHWSLLMASGSAERSFRFSLVRNLGGIAILGAAILGGWQLFVMAQIARVLFNIGVGEFFLRRFLPFRQWVLWRALLPALASGAAVALVYLAAQASGQLLLRAAAVALVLAGSYTFLFKKIWMDKRKNEDS